jgi:hypothetical protein
MAFEDVILPDFVIADLYRNTLIESLNETAVNTKSSKENHTEKIRFLGDNKKNITVVVNDEKAVFIEEDKLQLLTNLLSACKLNNADVAIVNVSNTSYKYKQIKAELQPANLLLFGVNAKTFELPLVFEEYKLKNYDNCQILIAADLNNLIGVTNEVKIEKSKLWLCLKQMFAV